MKPSHSIFKSKTFWFNVLGFVVSLLNHTSGSPVVSDEAAAGILAAGNTALRFFTDAPVHVVKPR